MHYTQSEKMEIIRLVEAPELAVRKTLRELGIHRSTFYGWYRRYLEYGFEGLANRRPNARKFWNKIPEAVKKQVVGHALECPEKSPREMAWSMTDQKGYFISESSVHRILKACDLITSPAYVVVSAKDRFDHPTTRVNELWQMDFSYFKILGWSWYYLSTVMDDFSRYILAWKLFSTMSAMYVQETLDLALKKTGLNHVKVRLNPRLLSDNGPCYVSKDLKAYLEARDIMHIRSAPYHTQTQGKIERYHRTIRNVINLEHYYFPGELEKAIDGFVTYYNFQRYHESIDNLIPADVFYGRGKKILVQREITKSNTYNLRRIQNFNKPVEEMLLANENCIS